MQPYPPLQTLLAAALPAAARVSTSRCSTRRSTAGGGFAEALERHQPRPGRGVRGQFQFPDQDVPAAQSRTGVRDGAHARRARQCPPSSTAPTPPTTPPSTSRRASTYVMGAKWRSALALARGGVAAELPASRWTDGAVRVRPRRAPIADLDCAAHAGLGPGRRRAVPRRRGPTRTAISRSTWSPAAAARIGATGAPSRSGATPTTAAPPAWWPRRCCELKTRFQPDHLWFADDIFALSHQWTLDSPTPWNRWARRSRSRCNRAAT